MNKNKIKEIILLTYYCSNDCFTCCHGNETMKLNKNIINCKE